MKSEYGKSKDQTITLVLLSLCTPVNGNEPLHTSYELGKVKENKTKQKDKGKKKSYCYDNGDKNEGNVKCC